MSMEEKHFSRLKNVEEKNEGVQQQEVELIHFTEHGKLVSELRQHILTYSDASTLFNYSQCSNFCNSEVQRFNMEPPRELRIIEETDGVLVKMAYVKHIERGLFNSVQKKIYKKFVFSEDMIDEMQKYLMKYYKYVGSKNTIRLEINVKQWPTDVMKMKYITNIENWTVTFYNSMCSDFIEYFTRIDLRGKYVTFHGCLEEADRVVIPAGIFKAEGFRYLRSVKVFQRCEIDGEDFINLQNENIFLISSVSFEDIRAKVHKWNSESQSEDRYIYIVSPQGDDRVLDIRTIFPTDELLILPIPHRCLARIQIGKVIVSVRNDYRCEAGARPALCMKFNKD